MTQDINLYDASLRVKRDPLAFESTLGILSLVLIVVIAASFLARASSAGLEPQAAALAAAVEADQATMQANASAAASSKPDPALLAEVAKTQRMLARRRIALQSIEAGGSGREGGFSTRLEALARQSIPGLWLTGVALRDDDMLLRGRALHPASIPAYVQRLEREPAVQGRVFRALHVERPLEGAEKDGAASLSSDRERATPAHAAFVEFTLTGPSGSFDRSENPATHEKGSARPAGGPR